MRGLKPDGRRQTTDDRGQTTEGRRAVGASSVLCPSLSVVRRLSSVVGLLFLAAAASGVAGEIEYQASYDAAIAAAKANHVLVMVIIVAPIKDAQGRDIGKAFREEVLPSEPIAKLIQKCFAPVLIDLEKVKTGKQGVPPAVKLPAQIPIPYVVFFDGQGQEVGKLGGFAPAQEYLAHLKGIADKLATVPLPKEARDAERSAKRGRDAMDRKDYRTALDALTSALDAGLAGSDKDQAQRMLAEIQGAATGKFDEGRSFETEKKLGSAIRAYRECAWKFPSTEAAGKATGRLDELAKDTELRKKLREFRARKLMAQAEAAFAKSSYGPAVAAVDQILKDFADTEPVEAAKKLRARLDADPNTTAGVQEDRVRAEAERLLQMADTFRRNKMTARALTEYKKIVEKFPKTSYAQTAQDKMQEITEESKER